MNEVNILKVVVEGGKASVYYEKGNTLSFFETPIEKITFSSICSSARCEEKVIPPSQYHGGGIKLEFSEIQVKKEDLLFK